MLTRKRKHKRIEVERMADRKRQRAPERTPEQLALSRRAFLFKGLAVSSFTVLTGRLWQLQVVDHAEIKDQGVSYSQRFFPLKPARGMIYDRNGQLLADNQKSWAVEIVPANLPDDEATQNAIFAALTDRLKMGDIVTIVPKEFPVEGREDIYGRLAAALGLPVERIRDPVEDELRAAAAKKRATLPAIQVGDELPPERLAAAHAAARDLPGVRVVNPIKYKVDATYDIYVPLVIKRGIPKEVALGIEANRLYLPGVQIDDQALTRRYHVGAELGHILGFTGPINREEYEAAVVTDQEGRALTDEAGRPLRRYFYDDYIGKAGVEAALEDTLRGQAGGYVAQVNPRGQITGEYAQYRRDPVDGKSVVLTVPVDFQRDVIGIVEQGIKLGFEYVEGLNAEKRGKGEHIMHPRPPGAGAAVVLNPQTGEILAMVSLPGYDHRHFAQGISQAQLDAYLETHLPEEQRRHPLQNRCHALVFPPGSTIKPFMAAMGLQEGKIKPDTKIRCHGWIEIPHTWDEMQRDKYYCHTRDASHGDLNVLESLAVSCDVFYYSVGAPNQKDERGIDLHYYLPNNPNPINFYGVGIEVINTYLGHFGFGQKTGVELVGEDEGLVPGSDWKEKTFPGDFWSVGDTVITAIGQGYDLVTPLQLCNATAAIANGGTLYRPTLVREVRDADDRVVSSLTPRVLRKLPIDRHHLDVVREGMRMSITDSRGLVSRTAQGIDRFPLPPNVDAGVKTGTAEYGNEVDELGRTLRAHAWCAAFAPFNNPQVCVVAFIEGGFGSAAVAAPVASGIINAYFARFGGQQ